MAAEGELAGRRLARGCRCFAAFEGEKVIGYGWISTRSEWIGEIRLEINPGPGDAYIWNCVTVPARRRRGIFRAVLVGISATLKAEGNARLWIASGNGGAVSVLPHAGYRPVLAIRAPLSVAGLRLLRAVPIPGAEPTLVSAARRVLAGGGQPLGSTRVGIRPPARRH